MLSATFSNLNPKKRKRIIQWCIHEFSIYGYERSSTDRIVKKAGISKGGLYEYIESKEELFIYIAEYSYDQLYCYIEEHCKTTGTTLSKDILDRFHQVSSIAIDFYVDHPRVIALIDKCARITDHHLASKINRIFSDKFQHLFGDVEQASLEFDKELILDLLRWLLIKTRNDFLIYKEESESMEEVKKRYIASWDFYLNIFRNGIYSKTIN